ncbi:MAG: hypothetical protein WC750_04730 [Patescibacteria group bacterium]|jgi:hypothetical protein
MPHGYCPPPLPFAEVAAEAIERLMKEATKEFIIDTVTQRPLASIYLDAAKRMISSQMLDQHMKNRGEPYAEYKKGYEAVEKEITAKAASQSDAAYAKVAIDMLCWRAARECAEYRPSNVIKAEILKKVVAQVSEIKEAAWNRTPCEPGKEPRFEGRVAALLRPVHGSMDEYQDFPTHDSLKEELDKVEGHVILMVMKRQLMHIQLPWGLYRCGPHAILLYTGRDSARGLVNALRPHKERIDSALLYYAHNGPFSEMNLIAELIDCVRSDATVIVMNCRCNSGREDGPKVVAEKTGRTDVHFWSRARHDMENVMLGQLVHFAKHGRLSLVEPIRRTDLIR